jgi:type I restriction enzyme S subunit
MSSSDAAGEEGEVACGMRKLSDLCLPTETVDPRKSPQKEFCYVDISSVDNRTKRIVGFQTLLGSKAPSRARNLISAGDIILSTTRPNLNAVAMVPPELDGQVCSTGFCVLRAGQHLDRDFLFLCLQRKEFIDALVDLVKGALYPAVSDRQVFAQSIPLPDLPTQRRIAARLTEQMAGVEAARKAVEAQQDALKALVASKIREGLANPETELRPVGEVMQEVSQGVGETWSDFPVLGATRSGIAPAKEPVGKNPHRYKPVTPGTVFYNPMRIMIGSIAMVDDGDEVGITSPDYVVVRPRSGEVLAPWFYEWLRSRFGAEFISSLARGAVRERMLFSRLRQGNMPVPSVAWQLQFQEMVRHVRKAIAVLDEQAVELSKLPAAYLRAAFEGIE